MSRRQAACWWSCLVVLVGCEAAAPTALPALAPELTRAGKVVLGSPRLTAGVPGEGPLKRAQIEAWLADPENHEPLDFVLPSSLRTGSEIKLDPDQTLTRAKIELGRQLYFDSRLAGAGRSTMSCAHCHHPEHGYSRWMVMPVINRNVSVGFNRILSREQFWDGRASSLEEQVVHPLTTPYEMYNTVQDAVFQISAVEGYRLQFERIYGKVTYAGITQALAAFERALVTGPSPYDFEELVRRYEAAQQPLSELEELELEEARRGMAEFPLSDRARRGRELFFSDRARCATCHSGPNFTDEQYHAVGLPPIHIEAASDTGRHKVTGREADRGAYKTPTLRNVAQTPPYMHGGHFKTLEEVVAWFNRPKTDQPHLSPALQPLGLSAEEQGDLVEFLKSLTGSLPPVAQGRLPE